MIRTMCISNKGYRYELEVGETYYFSRDFSATTPTNVVFGNCYKYVEDIGLCYLGLYPRNLFAIIQ